ncbi:MAG: iron-containing alcohol dehydrogenase, partial [Elusimicrobiales bacterium]|nr:iron-containing alcohol dehydrogenase [Elusimicrobiales bacterium]
EHSGVKSNPVLSHTQEGIKKARENNCDMILAVGGGSVIDEGKAIAAGMKYEGNVWDFFNGTANIKHAAPIITVLTLAATGSEMNAGCVITNEETKQKLSAHSPKIFPAVSMLDPKNTISVSKEYTAYGVIDALSHVFEGYFTTQSDSALITDEICEGICRTLIKSMNTLKENLLNYDARANVMWSATLALNSLQRLGYKNTEFINHAIEHSLSAIYDIPHGAGLSIVMPAWFKFQISKGKIKRIVKFGKNVLNIDGKDDKAIAKETIKTLENWFSAIGAPITLKEVNIPEKDIPKIAENAMGLINLWGMSYAKKSVEEILRKAA